jgi:hypothetical protein
MDATSLMGSSSMERGSVVLVPVEGWKRVVNHDWSNLVIHGITVTIIAAPVVLNSLTGAFTGVLTIAIAINAILIWIHIIGLLRTSDQIPALYTNGVDVIRNGLTGFKRVFVPFWAMENVRLTGRKAYQYLKFRSSVDGGSYVVPEVLWGNEVLSSINDIVTRQEFQTPAPRLIVYPSERGT